VTEQIQTFWRRIEEKGFSVFHIDWRLFFVALLLSLAGLITMNSFLPTMAGQGGIGGNYFFERQIIWLSISLLVFFAASMIDWRFLRRTRVIVTLFLISCFTLALLFVFGEIAKGAQSWFDFGGFSFQPSDPIKLVLILILAKYFSRRHIEIANIRHVIVSGIYAFIFFILVLVQPDFGAAIIIFGVWFGMVMVSGISRRHLVAVLLVGLMAFGVLWSFVFAPYQKQRIMT